jgi:gamma-glutamylcyclotransferase (GGCT)/AIG2-like uncharacterized protein YtfP
MSDYLFVYGTLHRGQPLHSHLAARRARFVGEGRIAGRLFDLGEYPGAIPDTRRFSTVRGEVHELFSPDDTLAILDDVEGFDPAHPEKSLFERRRVTADLEDGRRINAWVYFYRRSLAEATEIPDGDFTDYRNQ